jgi:hypothetical protein
MALSIPKESRKFMSVILKKQQRQKQTIRNFSAAADKQHS